MTTSAALALAVTIAFGLSADDGTVRLQSLINPPDTGVLQSTSVTPEILVSVSQGAAGKDASLQSGSRMEIIRYVDGEFAKALKPLPAGKDGLKFNPTVGLNPKTLNKSLQSQGAAIQPGDTVRITRIEFRTKVIVIELNGGGTKHFHIMQHLQIGVGGTTPEQPAPGNPQEGNGSTLFLDYGRTIPDMSPDDLKKQLSPLLDFASRSAAVNWVDTLPPEFKQAIQDRRAMVGMDHEMVLAALGRPDHKVRERDPQGDETEDWIYGDPPARTVFVTFEGDKVIRVKDFD